MSTEVAIIPATLQSPHRPLSYGSFHDNSANPGATISDVLDILTRVSAHKHISTPNQSKPCIQLLGATSLSLNKNIHVPNPNDSYMKQHLSADMSHHILAHGLKPLMYGTPNHHKAHQIHSGDSPIHRVIFNMLNSIIGSSVVGLPFVFSISGLFGGLLLMFFFALISTYSLKLLIISGKFCGVTNYEDLCEYLFGLKGYIFVSVTMLVLEIGATLSCLIILGDSISHIISIWGYDSKLDRQFMILIVSIFIILPTILPRDLSKIEKVSTFTIFSIILIMLIVVYEYIAYRFDLQTDEGYIAHIPDNINWGIDVKGFPMAIGIIAFAFVCHDSAFLVYNTLKNPTVPRWSLLACSGCSVAVLIFACFAVPGYLTFGDNVSDNILDNYDTFNPLIIAARCIFCITMSLTYPVPFFVLRHVLYSIFHHGPRCTSIATAPLWKHLLFTLPLFGANVVMGIFIENLGIVMSVSGSLSAVILAFVLPTMCYLKICEYSVFFWNEKGWHRKWRAFKTTAPPALLWLFGVCVAILCTFLTIVQNYQ